MSKARGGRRSVAGKFQNRQTRAVPRRLPVISSEPVAPARPGWIVGLLTALTTLVLWMPLAVVALPFGVWALCVSFSGASAVAGWLAVRFLQGRQVFRAVWQSFGAVVAGALVGAVALLGGVPFQQGVLAALALTCCALLGTNGGAYLASRSRGK